MAAKRSAGVALEVNLRIPLHACIEFSMQMRGSTVALDVTRSPKQGIGGPTKRNDALQKFF